MSDDPPADVPLWKRMAENAAMMIAGTPQARALGMEVREINQGRALVAQPWREDLVGDPDTGVIAGGVLTTLLDNTCGVAAFAALREPMGTATLDLRIDYMRAAAPGRTILAEAHCYKVTRSVAFVRAVAHDGDPDDPVATAQAAFMLSPIGSRRRAGAPA
jgi:uncharacterized protein (TIGR00369 family)